MPIIALDSENEHVEETLQELKRIFKLRKLPVTEKRGLYMVTILRKLTAAEEKRLEEISEGVVANKSTTG